jgi:hypothetical protein
MGTKTVMACDTCLDELAPSDGVEFVANHSVPAFVCWSCVGAIVAGVTMALKGIAPTVLATMAHTPLAAVPDVPHVPDHG